MTPLVGFEHMTFNSKIRHHYHNTSHSDRGLGVIKYISNITQMKTSKNTHGFTYT